MGLEGVEQPLQASLIIVVFLAFDDDLLSTVDELFTSPWREILLRKEGLGVIVLLGNAILMLLRDPIRGAVL